MILKTITIAENITTQAQAEERFNLAETDNDQFFTESFESLPKLTDQERTSLDRVKRRYHYHRKDGLLAEGTVGC